MTDYRSALKKVLGIAIVLLYMNSLFIIYVPQVFASMITLVPIILLSIVVCIDIAIRPISTKPDQFNRALMAVAFLLLPLMVALPHFEFIYLTMTMLLGVISIVSLVGNIILLLGSAVLLASRVQIGQYGGPRITVEDDHALVTTGMYRYIRNPQYLGFLLLLFGYAFSLGSILVASLIVIGLFAIFRSRIMLEEGLLLDAFGDEYRVYKERTWRLVPRVY
ncbi:MAG: methyltransferase family protein [Candidatus Thorarchaeota archaeon]|jgi:protein-S-isoprenylcysteine O-methyltransferase Ste14